MIMAQFIDKDAVSELKDLYEDIDKCIGDLVLARSKHDQRGISDAHWKMETLMVNTQQVLSYILQHLEVKEVESDRKFECPNIKIEDAIEVSSRMKYIDEDLKPIAEFIMDYCSWNLHKDEWNQPTIEVPLFRVLDALAQRGKPYCFR